MSFVKLTASALAIAAVSASAAAARDQIQISGSSTVLPYAEIVAEAFGENFPFPTPVVESGGSSAGLKKFCEGVGENTIDIANSSRPIREAEIKACADAGVTEIMQVQIGYDGIVFASAISGPAFTAFTEEQVYKALAKDLWIDGKLAANPNKKWSDVDAALPEVEILAFIPGTKHGTREVFVEKVITAGCEHSGAKEAMTAGGVAKDDVTKACAAVREDGKSVDIDRDYTETLARIESNPTAIGVFGLSFYENNMAKLKVATMNGVTPSVETISSGEYPVSRPLFFYVKKAHIGQIPGLKEYAEFFVSDAVAGAGGPLATYGLVPDPQLVKTQAAVAAEQVMGSGS